MKKMSKLMLISASCFLILTAFSGCSNDEVQCNGDVTTSIVKDLLKSNQSNVVFNHILLEESKKIMQKKQKDSKKKEDPFMNMMLQNGQADGFLMMAVAMKKNDESSEIGKLYAKLLKNVNSVKIALKDFITTSRNKELNKVGCKATADMKYDVGTYSFDLEYTAQPTDDGKKTLVEITSFKSN